MKINIYGLGYVGTTTAACLALKGHDVIGIDIDQNKVEMINHQKSPIIEPQLEDIISKVVASGHLKAVGHTIAASDISFICVGTPSNENGSIVLDYIKRVAEDLGDYLRKIGSYHVVNVRSTVLPGTVEGVIIPAIEKRSEKRNGIDFGVCMNPEFMREGTSVRDFFAPPYTLIGQNDSKSAEIVANVYENIDTSIIRTSIRCAEMIKYVCNGFHALKISFANEIGRICKHLNIDSHDVMDIFCKDEKLNISSSYLKPGFAFGGSCLPKDLRSLIYSAKKTDLEIPVLEAILQTNEKQIKLAFDMIKKTGKRKIGFLGISFKAGTDDLRESPIVELIERLIGKGYHLHLYDAEVSLARLRGSNKQFIKNAIPHISSLLRSSCQEVVDNSEVVVIGKDTRVFRNVLLEIEKDKIIIDLVRLAKISDGLNQYDGICW